MSSMLNVWYTKHKKANPPTNTHIYMYANANEQKKLKPVISIKKNESIDFVGHAKVLTLTLEFFKRKRETIESIEGVAEWNEEENNQQRKIKYSKEY